MLVSRCCSKNLEPHEHFYVCSKCGKSCETKFVHFDERNFCSKYEKNKTLSEKQSKPSFLKKLLEKFWLFRLKLIQKHNNFFRKDSDTGS